MPGHKGNWALFDGSVSKYDVTELDNTDNLYYPQKELIDAERLASDLFGVRKTVFCAGGATLGNQTALSFFAGRKVIFERNIHISALNAAMLLDIKPIFVYNRIDQETGVVLPVEKEDIEEELRKDHQISAVFITSPNYYGLCADLSGIKKTCEKYGVILITDNSHGTHLSFLDDSIFNSHCSNITIDSAHKTLPVLTGGAFIHFNSDIKRDEICSKMLAFGSTSPSFLILSSLDYARAWCSENKAAFSETERSVNDLKQLLRKKGATVVESDISDPLRICLACRNATEIDSYLKKNGLIPEMCDGNCLVFMFSPFNNKTDFNALKNVFSTLDFEAPIPSEYSSFPRTELICPIKSAFYGKKIETDILNAAGKIAASPVIPYPPGVPILIPGEFITDETVKYLIFHNTDKVMTL